MAPLSATRARLSCALGLFALAFALYLPSAGHGWILYDDAQYVLENEHVLGGLTSANTRWALTSFEAGNWHPLTWLSHQLVVELAGPGPGPQHVANALLHGLCAALAFLALAMASAAFWRPALVGALLAVHPVHVESVAWVAERKDVLCAALTLGALCAYVRFARAPSAARMTPVALLLALALAAKPMAVSLPFLLLLWDVWPLARVRRGEPPGPAARLGALLREKLVLFALCAASAGLTLAAQAASGAVQALERVPLAARASNALVSWARYLGALVWPADLALPYPWRAPGAGAVALAAVLLAALSALAWRERARRPWLPIGWLWFLGALVPVIGLVQVGHQARADRYLYLPALGVYWIAAWGAGELAARRPSLVRLVPAAAVAALLAFGLGTALQLRHWRDAMTLFEHTLAVTGPNLTARRVLASAWLRAGELERAERELRAALALAPEHPDVRASLARCLADRGRVGEALALLDAAPAGAAGDSLRALLLARAGRFDDARVAAERTLELEPTDAQAAFALGIALAGLGRDSEALVPLERATALAPELSAPWLQLGLARVRLGRMDEALLALREAVRASPGYEERLALGSALGELGRGDEACTELAAAVLLRPEDAEARWRLGGALLLAGRIEEAREEVEALQSLDPTRASSLEELVRRVEAGFSTAR